MFIDIVAWDRLGEICNQYLKKGMSALVEGRLVIRKYDDKDGNKRTAVEVVASDMQMLDSKGRNGESGGSFGGGSRLALVEWRHRRWWPRRRSDGRRDSVLTVLTF
jgi:single stranded DNA-binding protein